MIEANIKADAAPAASAITEIAIISCPAPFERLEVFLRKPQPSATGRPGSLIRMSGRRHGPPAEIITALADHVRQKAKEPRALDGAGELALLLGGDRGDPARHDLAALGHVTHQQLGILVVDLRRIRTRKRAALAAAEKRTACTSFSHDSYSSLALASASSRGRRGPRSPRKPPPSSRKPPPRSSRSRSRSALRIIADGSSSSSSTRTLR